MPSLFKNASWGAVSAGIRLLFGMANLFLAIKIVGAESYGYVALMLAISAIYLTFVNSIHTIVVTHAADLKRQNDSEQKLLKLFSAVWIFTVSACLLITFLVIPFGSSFIQSFIYFGNEPELTNDLKTALLFVVVLLILQMVNAANIAVIESLGRFDLAARTQVFGPILAFLIFMFVITQTKILTISDVVMVYVLGVVLDSLFSTYSRLKMGFVSAYLPQVNAIKVLPNLMKGGLSLQGSRLVVVFVDPFNKYLLNIFIGPASVTVYEVVMKVISGIQGLFGGAFRTFLQLTNEMRLNSGQEYIKSLRFGLVPAFIMHAIAGVFIIFLSHFWLYEDTENLPELLFLMIPASVVIIFIAPLYFALIGIRDLAFIFRMNLTLALFNVIGSVVFIPILGVMGCAVGFTIAIFYNAIMEYLRYLKKVGTITDLNQEMRSLSPKILLILLLTILSILSYIMFRDDQILVISQSIILVSLLILFLKEPLIIKIFKKIMSSLIAKTT